MRLKNSEKSGRRFFDGELVGGGIEPGVGDAAVVQLFEERFEPVGMFVINCDG